MIAFVLAEGLMLMRPAHAQEGAHAVMAEKDLDSSATVTLATGEHFRINVPLRPSRAVNLGTAKLDVTLTESRKAKVSPELHLVAILAEAQTMLKAGETQLTLHGVAPEFGAERAGEYHPSDYSIHLGSGNVTNIGVPDDTLIDTERLNKKLQALRIRLAAAIAK